MKTLLTLNCVNTDLVHKLLTSWSTVRFSSFSTDQYDHPWCLHHQPRELSPSIVRDLPKVASLFDLLNDVINMVNGDHFYPKLLWKNKVWNHAWALEDVYWRIEMQSHRSLDLLKGQMHHHDDLGSKCAYTCHLSNKTTRKSVLLSTPQIWLMKVSKKLA